MNGNTWKAFGVVLAVVLVGLISWDIRQGARIERERIAAAIANCELILAADVWNAKAWTQAQRTWSERAKDTTLSRRERSLAHDTAIVYSETSNQLRRQLVKCEPLVRHGDYVIDKRALREAKGTL